MSQNYHDCYTALFERAYMLFGNEKQQAIAKKTGLPQGIISKIRSCYEYPNETYQPQAETVYKIAKAYNVSTDYLLGLTDVKTTDKATAEMCKGLNLSEDAINLLRGDVDGASIWVAEVINILVSDLKDRGELDSLLLLLGNFFDALETNKFKIVREIDRECEFIDVDEKIRIWGDCENGCGSVVKIAPKNILITEKINDILERLNSMKRENTK